MTGGSTTSESSCAAVRLACDVLLERLAPVHAALAKERREKGGEPPAWQELVAAAGAQEVDLNAQAQYKGGNAYHNYGAALSVVEVDVLTGETTIRSADIKYDCGRSLNPAVDIGQCEGGFMMGTSSEIRTRNLLIRAPSGLLARRL